MLTEKKALLLSGSPKAKDSVSAALGSYVSERLQAEGWSVQKFRANLVMKGGFEEFFAAMNEADVVLILFPLYADGLPAPLIRVLEQVGVERKDRSTGKEQRLLAIANCGFQEMIRP
jgi:putative NADPH-quinone reductase